MRLPCHRSQFDDRERKRRRRLEKAGELPSVASLNEMYEKTQFEARAEGDVEEAVAKILLNEQLHKAIADLPEKNRDVIRLRYFRFMTIEDAAEVLGIPTPTAHSREKSALAKLKNILGEIF